MQRPVQPGISVFNFTFAHNHTPVALLFPGQIAVAAAHSGKFIRLRRSWKRGRGKCVHVWHRPALFNLVGQKNG